MLPVIVPPARGSFVESVADTLVKDDPSPENAVAVHVPLTVNPPPDS